jgi:hypothetical protein
MVQCSSPGQSALTEAGFHFLLLDTYNQLWTLLRGYIASAEKRSGEFIQSNCFIIDHLSVYHA